MPVMSRAFLYRSALCALNKTNGKNTNSILFAHKKLVAFACTRPLGEQQQFFFLSIESNFCLHICIYCARPHKYLRISNVAHICSPSWFCWCRPIRRVPIWISRYQTKIGLPAEWISLYQFHKMELSERVRSGWPHQQRLQIKPVRTQQFQKLPLQLGYCSISCFCSRNSRARPRRLIDLAHEGVDDAVFALLGCKIAHIWGQPATIWRRGTNKN